MSTPGAAYDASLEPKEFFCYTCNQTVFIDASAAAAGELYCPECGAFSLEEVTATGATIRYFPFNLTLTASSPPGSPSSSTAAPAPPSKLSNFITSFLGLQDAPRARSRSGTSAAGTGTTENEPEPFDRLAFFQNYIRDLERRGDNIEILLDGNVVDGLELEQLMSANDPNLYGSPPATESAMSTLGDVVLTDAVVEGAECAVCKQDFSSGDEAKQMGGQIPQQDGNNEGAGSSSRDFGS